MTEEAKKPRPNTKLAKSEITTVRLDPKLRYLAELAARKQRRSLSSLVEWAIEDALSRIVIRDDPGTTIAAEANELWDVDEADRLAVLAMTYPELLTHEEQVLWKLIRECGFLWRGSFAGKDETWTWAVRKESLVLSRLREKFDAFKAVAEGRESFSTLPTWPVTRPAGTPAPASVRPAPPPNRAPAPRPAPPKGAPSGFDDMDDDIPF